MNHQAKPQILQPLTNKKLDSYFRAESNAIALETVAALLLFRLAEEEEQARQVSASLKVRDFSPLLPVELRWNELTKVDERNPSELSAKLSLFAEYLKNITLEMYDETFDSFAFILKIPQVFERLSKTNSHFVMHEFKKIEKLEFDSSAARANALEYFDSQLAERNDTYHSQFLTSIEISRLIAAIADPKPGQRIYDPCFGLANLPIQLNLLFKDNQRHVKDARFSELSFACVEKNEIAFLCGAVRLILSGIKSTNFYLQSSLAKQPQCNLGSDFDVVVADPPLGAKLSNFDFCAESFRFHTSDSVGLFIQHCFSMLKEGGRAIILVPDGFLYRRGIEKKLRRFLLEGGHVEAVVGLPRGAFESSKNIKQSLLVLRKSSSKSDIRMADLSRAFPHISMLKSSLKSFSGAVSVVDMALKNESEPNGSFWEMSFEEFSRKDWNLTPRKWEKIPASSLRDTLIRAIGKVPICTLSKLSKIRSGVGKKSCDLSRDPKPGYEHEKRGAIPYITVSDLWGGKIKRPSAWLTQPSYVEKDGYGCLQEGDILVSRIGSEMKFGLLTQDHAAVGGYASNGLFVLTIDKARIDPSFLFAYLDSKACKNWLIGQTFDNRRLSVRDIDSLPIPQIPLLVQEKVAKAYELEGTDVLILLSRFLSASEESVFFDQLPFELSNIIPDFEPGKDVTPALFFDEIYRLINQGRNRAVHSHPNSNLEQSFGLWLVALNESLRPLVDLKKIPKGPSLLSLLQAALRGISDAHRHLEADFSQRTIVESISVRLHKWIQAAIDDLMHVDGLRVCMAPEFIFSGEPSDFSVELKNVSLLPLRNLVVTTYPSWGSVDASYLDSQGILKLPLQGIASQEENCEKINFRISWRAITLGGEEVRGESELAIRVVSSDADNGSRDLEFGGSPYIMGPPLEPGSGNELFYGRAELLNRVARQIEMRGNVVLLEGNRRAGKTSILKHLVGRDAIKGWFAVYSSLQGPDGTEQAGLPAVSIFREMAGSIAKALFTELQIDTPLPNGALKRIGESRNGIAKACREGISVESPFSDFREYLEIVLTILNGHRLGLVMMLDEFDKLQEGIDSGVTSPQVPENIRFLIQTYPKFSAILTGSRRLKRMREEYWSALYGLGVNIVVTTLDPDSARRIVTEPVRDQLTYSQDAIERTIEVTACHPYLMQCLCSRVFDYAAETKTRFITKDVVNDASRVFIRDNEHFASLWTYAAKPPPESGRFRRQLVLFLCALGFKEKAQLGFGVLREQITQQGIEIKDKELDEDLAFLRELDLIDQKGPIGSAEYCLSIPLMGDWIEQHQDMQAVVGRARLEANQDNV